MVAPPYPDAAVRLSTAVQRGRALLTPPVLLAALAFIILFTSPFVGLVNEWWTDPDAGHGLLLFPVAIWLAWREGVDPEAKPNVRAGTLVLIVAVVTRALGSAAAELFTQRLSIWIAAVGLVVFCCGWRQVRRWWLAAALLPLTIPLPAMLMNVLASPLQFKASQLATSLIHWRQIPVRTTGNVINIGRSQLGPPVSLFVAEACSGLRSLTALLALGVLIGGTYLRNAPTRILLVLLTVPVAVAVNAVRIFLTAFLVYFVDPAMGQGAVHRNEGWLMFMVAFLILGAIASMIRGLEYFVQQHRPARV